MKKHLLFLALLAIMSACSPSVEKVSHIRVGVFDGFGGSQTCIWETVSAISLDPEMSVRTITTADIADIQYLTYLPDVAAAAASEKDPQTAARLQEQLKRLQALRKH